MTTSDITFFKRAFAVLVIIVTVVMGVQSWGLLRVNSVVEKQTKADETQQLETMTRRIEAAAARAYLCGKVNEIPGKIDKVLGTLDQLRKVISSPTTTVVVSSENLQDVLQLQKALELAIEDLRKPIDCDIATTGTTSPPTTTKP